VRARYFSRFCSAARKLASSFEGRVIASLQFDVYHLNSHVSCFAEFELKELVRMACQAIAFVCAVYTHIRRGSCFEQSNSSFQKALFFTYMSLKI